MKVVLWDFDETLAERPGRWGGCILEIVERDLPGRAVDETALRQALRSFYPWHFPDVAHEHLNEPDDWWAALHPGLVDACRAGGLTDDESERVAAQVRSCYASSDAFSVYEDTVDALELLRDAGWRQAIVSNHVPELADLVDALGLSHFFDAIFTSARTGYEKPHPRSLQLALEYLGADTAWMIGNSEESDIAAADAIGIPSVLVKRGAGETPLLDAARKVLAG